MNIFVNVINQKMIVSSCIDELVAGTQQFVKFRFNMDETWDGLVVFAQFRQGENAYNQYLDEENCVYLPPEIEAGSFTLMLYGSYDKVIGTTNYLTFKVNKNILVSDAQSTEISTSLYNQLIDKVSMVENRIDNIEFVEGVSYNEVQPLTDEQKQMARANIDAVSTTELTGAITAANAKVVSVLPKVFTDDEKAQARENIGAFDASLVKSSPEDVYNSDKEILTMSGTEEVVTSMALTPWLPDDFPVMYKRWMREHLEVDGGKWEKLFTIEGDGDTTRWEYTSIPNGAALKLSAVAITVTQTVAESANVYGQLYGYYNDTYVNVTTISKILTTGVLNGQATAVIQPNKGYYEAFAVDMTKGNPANMSYSGFRQFMASTADLPYINKIKIVIQNTVKMSAGNTIDVWGVKYYE